MLPYTAFQLVDIDTIILYVGVARTIPNSKLLQSPTVERVLLIH